MAEQQRILSCISRAVLVVSVGGYRPSTSMHLLSAAEKALLLAGNPPLHIDMKLGYRIIRGANRIWLTLSTGYSYSITDAEGREILAYHWHPHVLAVSFPHLHLGPAATIGHVLLAAAHLPTGPVGLTDIVRLLLRDFGVPPARDDWEHVLTT